MCAKYISMWASFLYFKKFLDYQNDRILVIISEVE